MKALIPKSKARTAYGLLSEIAAIITEEPKRLSMREWKVSVETAELGRIPNKGFPACGTVGCIGGWVETLKRGVSAEDVLGISCNQSERLFYPTRLCSAKEQQTPEHAALTVAHIRKFQKAHRAQLLAKKV